MATIDAETQAKYVTKNIELFRVIIMLQGHIETLQLAKPDWNDERSIRFDEMIANMKHALSFLGEFDEEKIME